jgi:uncharacterized membrane protein
LNKILTPHHQVAKLKQNLVCVRPGLLGVLRRNYWQNGLSTLLPIFYVSDMAHAAGEGTVARIGLSEAIFGLAFWLGLRLWARYGGRPRERLNRVVALLSDPERQRDL